MLGDNATAISVRSAEGLIKHYEIFNKSGDQTLYISKNEAFETIEDLVVHYMSKNVTSTIVSYFNSALILENEIEPGYILEAYKPFKDSLPLLN